MYMYQEGNHSSSTIPILRERVTLRSGKEVSRMTGNELHDGAERGPVDGDGARRTKLKCGQEGLFGSRD